MHPVNVTKQPQNAIWRESYAGGARQELNVRPSPEAGTSTSMMVCQEAIASAATWTLLAV